MRGAAPADAIETRRLRPEGPGVELWEIPESSHIGGLDARPAEYERRVVSFFDRSLRSEPRCPGPMSQCEYAGRHGVVAPLRRVG